MKRILDIGSTPESTIVVTGMGAVCAAGENVDAIWRSVIDARSPATWFSDAAVSGSPRVPACVVPDEFLKDFPLKRYSRMDRSVHLAMNAAAQAFDDAKLNDCEFPRESLGVVLGTSRGPIQTLSNVMARARAGRSIAPCSSAHTTIGSACGAVALALNARGPCQTVSATCASGAHAIVTAAQQLLLGTVSYVIAGGTDAPLCDAVIRQMQATGVLGLHEDPRLACRPFDRDRNGTILGEGAAFLALETLATAQDRSASVLATLTGWAIGTDGQHETKSDDHGTAILATMEQALRSARREPKDLWAINLHGTGTVKNDQIEAMALRKLFGPAASTFFC
jgi:3-oxoacyl-[acyl-carrier-protein] synthase II